MPCEVFLNNNDSFYLVPENKLSDEDVGIDISKNQNKKSNFETGSDLGIFQISSK